MSGQNQFPYLHGFNKVEQDRLRMQARFAEHEIYQTINYTNCKNILEIGSGVGAQTDILLRRFPELKVTGIELSDGQIESAKQFLASSPHEDNRYEILKMDAQKMDFEEKKFDGAFICWVLEHIPSPMKVLSEARRVLAPGSPIYITEVLNSSFFLDPYSPHLWKYWMAFNDYQIEVGGDPFVGAKLGNYLFALGFKNINLQTRTLHFDNRFPDQRRKWINFWAQLLLSASDQLIESKYTDEKTVKKAMDEMTEAASNPNSVFYYSFVQATATV